MDDVVRTVSRVKYPSRRCEVLVTLAGLADLDYQKRVWIDHILPTPTYYDELTLAVHILYDDLPVFPDPAEGVGSIFVAGEEVDRLRDLGAVLTPMLDDLYGEPDAVYLADPRWPEVVRLAGLALAAMVRADPGWPSEST